MFQYRADAHGVTPRMDVEVLARAWVGEQIVVLRWWLEDEPPVLSPQAVTDMLLSLSLRGRYWANGFDGSPPDSSAIGAGQDRPGLTWPALAHAPP